MKKPAPHTFSRLKASRSGSASLIFALAFPALLGATGVAVDYAAVSQSRAKLQAAADSAALSIARDMTLGPVNQRRAQEIANLAVNANLDQDNLANVDASLIENGLAISIRASQKLKTPLGLIAKFSGVEMLEARALARVTASSIQTKLCMLSLSTKRDGGIFMHNGAAINAPECVMHSNSTDRNAVIIQTASQVTANLLCARGGIQNLAGQLRTTLLSDCPTIKDPLEARPEPVSTGGCTFQNLQIGKSPKAKPGTAIKASVARAPVVRTLSPGVYCGGLRIEGSAKVTLEPGIYIIRDGPLLVNGDAELVGKGVAFLFAGKKAYFRFLDNALIQLSAPVSGISAGILLWESKNFVVSLNSWQKSNCNEDDDDDDDGEDKGGAVDPRTGQPYPISPPGSCNGASARRTPGSVPPKKTNEHHINSDRAKELTGTIYLPNGLLLVDSRRPVADQSPYTVLVANKVDLFDGPNLVLNANYAASPVPVPMGLGIIGASQVRLGK